MKDYKLLKSIPFACLTIFFLLFPNENILAQISQPGQPWSMLYAGEFSEIPEFTVPKPDVEKIISEDNHAEKNGSFYRYGRLLPVVVNLHEHGSWDYLATGEKIWRLKIGCRDALALSLHFSNFHIPAGGKLFIYTADRKQVIGAFTEFTNHESGIFATQLLYSDEIIIEYNENAEPYGNVSFTISDIGYAYRGIYRTNKGTKAFGDSDSSCEVNVNCSPEGDNWQDQKRGAVRVSLMAGGNMGWCSGSLINNTGNDCTPYILTADHCGGDATTSEYLQWVFYFNYEAPGCANPSSEGNLASQSMTGCEVTAKGGQGGTAGSDFHLLKLNDAIPNDYNPYYNGWNWKNEGAMSGVSIHHPAGDIKKISTFDSQLTTSDWNGSGYDSHWEVTWVATSNGHGVTEGGSSGSPIFDSDGLLVGDLTGGSSYCNTPNAPDRYGKFSYSWESNGTLPEEQLKPWLDPLNSGDTTLSGRDQCGASGVYANFSWLPVVVVQGLPVDFINQSLGNITSYAWSFQNGNPANSSVANPVGIVFNTTGVHQVTLQVSGSAGSDTRIKDVNVIAPSPPIANFVASQTLIYTGDTISFLDLTTGGPTNWEWTFIGGTPSSSTQQNPESIVYYLPGNYTVSLSVSNPYGNHFHTKTFYIEVLQGNPNVVFCDTISNMETFDSLVVHEIQPWGLFPGHNPYNINEYADKYANSIYEYVSGFVVPIYTAHSSINSAIVRFKIWEGDSIPVNLLGYKDVYLTNLTANSYQVVHFDQDISISGTFFAGYSITYYQSDNYSGLDNVSIHMAGDRGTAGLSTLYVRYNNGWHAAKDLSLLNNIHTSLAIEPIVCRTTGIEEIDDDDNIVRIFPNPGKGIFNLISANPNLKITSVKVFSITGQQIKINVEEQTTNRKVIDLSHYNAGIYFLSFIVDDRVYVRKISLVR
ncbi:MAG: PKD domain-containing protein [Bacteroidota bacterium]|nr:PKD domain-containing protein [Bacteroidota bacterium]